MPQTDGRTVDNEPTRKTCIQVNIVLQNSHLEKQNTHSSAVISSSVGKPLRWLFSEPVCKSPTWKNLYRCSSPIFCPWALPDSSTHFMTPFSAKWHLAFKTHPCPKAEILPLLLVIQRTCLRLLGGMSWNARSAGSLLEISVRLPRAITLHSHT